MEVVEVRLKPQPSYSIARQLGPDNVAEVAAWIALNYGPVLLSRGTNPISTSGLWIRIEDHMYTITQGEWVVITDGKIRCHKDADFRRLFEITNIIED